MKLTLSPKLVDKLVWVPIILFYKISFPVRHLMPYYAETGHPHPPNPKAFIFFQHLLMCPKLSINTIIDMML
jgi:hypothetical protein